MSIQHTCPKCGQSKNFEIFSLITDHESTDMIECLICGYQGGIEDFEAGKSTVGRKYDYGKPELSLIPYKSLKEVAKVLMHGRDKYGRDNWKNVSRQRYIDAILRHCADYSDGELKDTETGLSHMAHICTNALFLIYSELKEEE